MLLSTDVQLFRPVHWGYVQGALVAINICLQMWHAFYVLFSYLLAGDSK